MKIGVSLKIDVTKIDKARLFKGAKGTYLDATAFIDLDEVDQYGNSGMIVEAVSKEERENNVKGNILGNTKLFYKDQAPAQANMGQAPQGNYAQAPSQPAPPPQGQPQGVHHSPPQDPFEPDDIPF